MRSRTRTPASLLLTLAVCVSAAHAQSAGGSSYSIFNIGDLQLATTVAAAGRGGTETGAPSPAVLNSINPAGWTDLRLTTLHGGFGFDQYQVSDAEGSVLQSTARIREFGIGIPFWSRFNGTIGLQVRPYSTISYRTQLERDVQGVDTVHRATVNYSGSGGVSRVTLGAALRPIPELSIGVAPHFYFGTIRSDNSVTFTTDEMTASSYRTETAHSGVGVGVGAAWEPTPDLRIGAAWESGTTLTRERATTTLYRQSGGGRYIDTISTGSDELSIPSRLSVGAGYTTGRFLIAADLTTQGWTTDQFATARGMTRVGLGAERLPSRAATASGFERWAFRFGGFMENSYYTVGGRGIDAVGGTLGARIPVADGTGFNTPSAIDISLELGTRGTTDDGLTRELFARLSAEFSLSELWFTTRKKGP